MDWAVYTPDFLFDLENVFLGNNEKPIQPKVNLVQALPTSLRCLKFLASFLIKFSDQIVRGYR